MKYLFLLPLIFLMGCGIMPLRGGKAKFVSPTLSASIQQPQNPKDESIQDLERITVTDPAQKVTVTEKLHTKIGAAQKDTARELTAKLSSLRGITWLGVVVFLFGVASAFYPPLKVIVGSLTTSAACAAAGLALIILPTLIVGNEILIISIAVGAVGIYWFAHRHGGVHAELKSLKETLK